MDNTQFTTMMVALDNQVHSLDNVVHTVSSLSYQMDILLGAIFAVCFLCAYRWHL